MTDKYEKFKQWLLDETIYMFYQNYQDNYGMKPHPTVISPETVFKEFEEKQKERKREKKVKQTILDVVGRNVNKNGYGLLINIDKLYDELKEEDVIK